MVNPTAGSLARSLQIKHGIKVSQAHVTTLLKTELRLSYKTFRHHSIQTNSSHSLKSRQ